MLNSYNAMQKQKTIKNQFNRLLLPLLFLILSAVLALGTVASQLVYADRFDEQINNLRQQNSNNQQADTLLENEEANLQAVLSRIQGEIAAIEEQIRANQAKRDETITKIAEAEAELEKQKELLGMNIRAMYIEGDISTLEMLASSKDLSEYMDKQQYRSSVQSKIKTTLDKVTALKAELKTQKETVEKLLADQQALQSQLSTQRAEQNRLVALNQDQQAQYEQSIQTNNAKIADLRRQQIAENARFTRGARTNIPDTTGYPWANAPFPNSIPDPWGMYQRQCVSYTAWKVYKSGRYMPYWGGRGNANQWDDNARAAGIPVDGNPRVGDIAVSNAGYYGHVMYVEAVYDDGTIYVSQYNAGWDGRYSEARISVGNLVFIHF